VALEQQALVLHQLLVVTGVLVAVGLLVVLVDQGILLPQHLLAVIMCLPLQAKVITEGPVLSVPDQILVEVVEALKTQVLLECKTLVAVMVAMDTLHLFLALVLTHHMQAVAVANCKTEQAAQAVALVVREVVALMVLLAL
jgi:hypothetical protein